MLSGEVEIDIELLYTQYRIAVRRNDIENILRFGELYFSALRDGTMTWEDRERIQNDVLVCAMERRKV